MASLDDAVRFERACLACLIQEPALLRGQAHLTTTTSCSPITRLWQRYAECTR